MSYKDTLKQVLKILVPGIVMIIVLLIINNYIPFNVNSRTSSFKLVIIDAVIGGIIYLGLSIKMKIPQYIFGGKDLAKIIKKLTFGKFKIKNKD